MNQPTRTLEEQKEEFKRGKLLATPIAGMIAWFIIGIGGIFLSPTGQALLLFIATGSIVYLGMFISKFTGRTLWINRSPKIHSISFFCSQLGRHFWSMPSPFLFS